MPAKGRPINEHDGLPEDIPSSKSSSSPFDDTRSDMIVPQVSHISDGGEDDELVIIETPGLIDVEQAERLRQQQENIKTQMWWRMILKKIRSIRLRLEQTSVDLWEDNVIDSIGSMLPVWKVTCMLDTLRLNNSKYSYSNEAVIDDTARREDSAFSDGDAAPKERVITGDLKTDRLNTQSIVLNDIKENSPLSEIVVASVEVCEDENQSVNLEQGTCVLTDMKDARPLTLGFPCILRDVKVAERNDSRNKVDQRHHVEENLGEKFLTVVKCAQCDELIRTKERYTNRARVTKCGHICCTECLSKFKMRTKHQCRLCATVFTAASCHELYL